MGYLDLKSKIFVFPFYPFIIIMIVTTVKGPEDFVDGGKRPDSARRKGFSGPRARREGQRDREYIFERGRVRCFLTHGSP